MMENWSVGEFDDVDDGCWIFAFLQYILENTPDLVFFPGYEAN